MPYFLIKWNAGFGESYDVVEDKDHSAAQQRAYEVWRDEAESNADYSAEPINADHCLDYCLDPEEYGLPPLEED